MSNLVCVSGDFCSGSTLMFTLFRKTGQYHCLYEPLHEDLREFLFYGLRAEDRSHHFFVDQYYREFKGLRGASALFDRRWGVSGLHVPADEEAEGLYRYFAYIIGASFGRCPRVMLKENRITFRLGWFRAKFPHARVVHIYRNKESQWRSLVRRVQADQQREDVGQDSVHFKGFGVAGWCEDLKARYPELDASQSRTGFERFAKLWERSYDENRRHAHVSIAYEDLIEDFMPTASRLFAAVGVPEVDVAALSRFVVPPQGQQQAPRGVPRVARAFQSLTNRALRRYASFRVRCSSPPDQRGGGRFL
jgi:hypothetical protein